MLRFIGGLSAWAIIVLLALTLLASPTALAARGGGKGKPPKDDPPPEPDPTLISCPGVFPAFVYQTLTKGKKRRDPDVSRVYAANRDGSCSRQIMEASETFQHLRLVDDGIVSRLAWSVGADSSVFMAELDPVLDASTGETSIILPLAPQQVFDAGPAPVGINGLDLSPDGTRLAIAVESGATGVWVNSIFLLDLDDPNCPDACPLELAYEDLTYSAGAPAWGREAFAGGVARIYFGVRVTFSDGVDEFASIAMIEEHDGVWSGPITIASAEAAIDPDTIFNIEIAFPNAYWDPDPASKRGDLLAVNFGIRAGSGLGAPMVVFDVNACLNPESGDPCFMSETPAGSGDLPHWFGFDGGTAPNMLVSRVDSDGERKLYEIAIDGTPTTTPPTPLRDIANLWWDGADTAY